MNKLEIIERTKLFLAKQIDSIVGDSPALGLVKPFVTRAINNSLLPKMETAIGMVADKEGNIDIDGILDETIQYINTSKPFTIDSGMLGDIEIGEGNIKLSIPYINKKVVLNNADLLDLKSTILNK